MARRLLGLLLPLFLPLVLPLPAAGAGLDLIFAADLAGNFTPLRCRGPAHRAGPGLPALAEAISQARERAQAEDRAALVVGGPGLLGPGNLSRYLLASPAGSRHAARLLGQAGVELLAPGTYEFAVDPAGRQAYLEAHRAAGRVAVLSNLDCRQRACPFLASHVVERGGLRVALLAVVGAGLPRRVGKDHVPWPVLAPATIAGEVKRLRARERVDAVVVVAELGTDGDPGGAVALVQALAAQGVRVDVVLAARLDHPSAGVGTVMLTSRTVIVGAPGGGAGVAAVSLRRGPAGIEVDARQVPAAQRSPALAEEVAALHGRMCLEWGREVAQLPPGGLSRAKLLTLVLDAMRRLARADIAFINAGAVDDRGLPLLSASQAGVHAALPFPARVVAFRATGKDITDHLKRYAPAADGPPIKDVPFRGPGSDPRAQLLPLRGLVRDGDSLKINGRPLDAAATYRLATIDFVAAGGDELLPVEFAKGKWTDEGVSVQEALLDYLRARGAASLSLYERPLWTGGLDLGVDLQSVTVTSPEGVGYDRPLLLRRPAVALKLDMTVRVRMDQPAHLLQLTVRSLYGQTYFSRGQGDAEAPAWQETADLLSGLLLYSYRGLSPRWTIVPTPYASVGLESEWSRPEQRGYHHLEASALGGLRMALGSKISLSAGVGARQELLARTWATDPTEADLARVRFLFSTTLEVLKRSLWPRLGNALLGELNLTYNFTDPHVLRSHELRSLGKLHVALGRPLYLTLGLDLYLYADRGRAPGVALDVTAGLKVLLDARTQLF